MKDVSDAIELGLITIGLAMALSVVFAIPEMWLWNYAMPAMFGMKEISWSQMTCLSLLSGMLLKSTSSASKG